MKSVEVEEAKIQMVAFKFDVEIVPNDLSSGCWNVVMNGKHAGLIRVNSYGEFNVFMLDGTDICDEDYHIESLRQASVLAIKHLVCEEIEKGW